MHVTASGQGLFSSGMDALTPFQLFRPRSLEEVLAIQRELAGRVTWAHGTTDLVAQFREGLQPEAVVSLRGVQDLGGVALRDDVVHIGAGLSHHQAATDPVLADMAPDLQREWGRIANPRVRFRGTMGGNLLARRHRYELILLLGAVDGIANFEGAAGQVELPVSQLMDAETSGALLTHVRLPVGTSLAYERSLRPALTVAMGGRPGDVTVAVGSASVAPWFVRPDADAPGDLAVQVADALPADRAFGPDRGVCQQLLSHAARRAATALFEGA